MGLTTKEAKQLNDSKAAIKYSWARACEVDGIAPSSMFVEFSKENRYSVEHNDLMLAHTKLVNRIKRNIARRERTEAIASMGLHRVKGALGGTYIE